MTSAHDLRQAFRLSRRNAASIVVLGLCVSFAIAWAGYRRAAPLMRLDNVFLDALIRHTASGKRAEDTVVIDIDDVSLAAVGQWPWPRYRVASMIQRIAAQQPRSIGLDILFPEPDRSSLANIQQTFKRDFGIEVAITGVPAGLLDNDGYLGYEIARTGAVGSNYFYFDHVTPAAGAVRSGLAFDGRTDLLAPDDATGVMLNVDAIASQTRVTGFVNNQIDEDGVLRRLPLLMRHKGVIHANLSLATVMRSLQLASGSIEADGDGLSIVVGGHRIPIDAAGFATLRFGGDEAHYRSIPAVDILSGNFRGSDLRGKIVFVGSSAAGLNDVHNTPLDPKFPGLKVQSVMAENILHDDFVRTPSWASSVSFGLCIVAGTVMSAVFVIASGVYPVVVGSLLVTLTLLLMSLVPFVRGGLFLSPGAPMTVVFSLFVLFFVARFTIEKRRAYVWLKQLDNARQVTIESMASVAETRDPETGAHIKRTQHYVKVIAEELARRGAHAAILTKEYIDLLFISAPLHDIGKVGVPDGILLKPGKLTPAEFEQMKRHAEFGREIIFSTAERIEGDNFLVLAGEIAATHHEKWDGTGYPLGLAGEAIPLSGRIMAVADIYDALISRRCYKDPCTHEWSTTFMRGLRGKTFDPAVLDAFFAIEDTIKAIAEKYRDEPEPVEPPPSADPTRPARLAAC